MRSDVWKDAFSFSVGEFRYRLVRKQLQDDATGRRVLEHGQYFQSCRVQPLLSARVKVHPLISTFYLDCVIDFVDKQRVLFHPASALDVPVSRLRQESLAGCTRCMAHAHCSRSGWVKSRSCQSALVIYFHWVALLSFPQGSTYFHATLSLVGQLLDELSILWVILTAMAIWVPSSLILPTFKNRRWVSLLFILRHIHVQALIGVCKIQNTVTWMELGFLST